MGSTTTKVMALDADNHVVFSKYVRHLARTFESVIEALSELKARIGETSEVSLRITGSIGMGIAERVGLPFVQEVVAASKCIQAKYPDVRSMIDIGGEDAKVVFFHHGEARDLRMNGQCAGGTGAFIDQMAIILGCSVDELNELALRATQVYPIASRCGVFCKTDIQNLIAKNVSREDIAASIFRAVAVQTVMTLAHGCEIERPLLFCGGPLTYIPALRKAFIDYMHLDEQEIVLPEHGTLLPAEGAALAVVPSEEYIPIAALIEKLREACSTKGSTSAGSMTPIFKGADDYQAWLDRMSRSKLPTNDLDRLIADAKPLEQNLGEVEAESGKDVTVLDAFLGIDSGSTTTKIVVLSTEGRIIYDYYVPNGGNPILAVEEGLKRLNAQLASSNAHMRILGSGSTGYGEDLIKAAFQLDHGIIETIAHFLSAHHIDPKVSFILDIGGQDMKAIFVQNGVINRMEINEACSSGCGSFLSTFATSLGYNVSDFADQARQSLAPCDLGTRCTVFMNSKVKQVLREGATVADLSAGLAYSVVRNCLYKVLKLKHVSELGSHIVVQGGTMRNDAVVRALELLSGAQVSRCDKPELMGAFGCALYAMRHGTEDAEKAPFLEDLLQKSSYTQKNVYCKGCENQCLVSTYRFAGGKTYFSGNRCEKVFNNSGKARRKGLNVYDQKLHELFDRANLSASIGSELSSCAPKEVTPQSPSSPLAIGIPRGLNQFEEFPFWHALFTHAGIDVVLSQPSNYRKYERDAGMVMSDNICFPAKLMHSHIRDLVERGVNRIFLPFVIYERPNGGQNSFNCPIVSGYSEVIKAVQGSMAEFISPTISFKDEKSLRKQCRELLKSLGVKERRTINQAIDQAIYAHNLYENKLIHFCEDVLREARNNHRLVIMLVGRPYHSDPLIQHQVADMIAGMGIDVITDDYVRDKDIDLHDIHHVSQWAYPTRILKAAKWCAEQPDDVHLVQFTSFGCGPDAFIVDEVRDLMVRHHKSLTLLKLDDINNVGSMKLRIRSLVESLKLASGIRPKQKAEKFVTTPIFDETMRGRKILAPYFTQFISPLLPSIVKLVGLDLECLPLSDKLSGDMGLRYANNEVCYPATLVVGDFVKAFREGRYDPDKTAVVMSQTGGQCRASNYISLIKKALVDSGFPQVPVISLTFGEDMGNVQPGFDVPWRKVIVIAFYAVLYSDFIAKLYYPAAVREREPGIAQRLKDKYLQLGCEAIERRSSRRLTQLAEQAAAEFDAACIDRETSKVGVVGEIFLKFHPFAQLHVVDWLMERGIEVAPPVLLDFFAQSFVNRKVNLATRVERSSVPDFIVDTVYLLIRRQVKKYNRIGQRFRYYLPFHDIMEEARVSQEIVTLSAQFGEGWLLPAEVAEYARQGINHVISLQPFGCIANHIVARGVERRIKQVYPDMNLLSLDFDSGVSEVNITNRLLLFIDNLKK